MNTILENIKISGCTVAVPEKWEKLSCLIEAEGLNPAMVEKFTKKTGVCGRYLAGPKQTASDLCYSAAEALINAKDIDRTKIGVVVFVTQTADYRTPSSAMVILHRLGGLRDVAAFDVNLGCSGFTHGLEIVGSIMSRSETQYGLLLCGDTCAREKDINVASFSSNVDKMLMGDAGSATLLEKTEDISLMTVMSCSDGNGYDKIICPHSGYRNHNIKEGHVMDEIAVYQFSTTEVPQMINELMQQTYNTADDYDCLVLHQANKLIMERIAKLTGFSAEKNISSIETFGNTASASIPTALVKNYGEAVEGPLHALMCGYGVGLSWSAVDCYINKADILPLLKTDEYFEDGF